MNRWRDVWRAINCSPASIWNTGTEGASVEIVCRIAVTIGCTSAVVLAITAKVGDGA